MVQPKRSRLAGADVGTEAAEIVYRRSLPRYLRPTGTPTEGGRLRLRRLFAALCLARYADDRSAGDRRRLYRLVSFAAGWSFFDRPRDPSAGADDSHYGQAASRRGDRPAAAARHGRRAG